MTYRTQAVNHTASTKFSSHTNFVSSRYKSDPYQQFTRGQDPMNKERKQNISEKRSTQKITLKAVYDFELQNKK